MSYENNNGADQPAHPRSLISAFVPRCLDSIIPLLAIAEISRLYLASEAEQPCLSFTWSGTPRTGFLVIRLIFQHDFMTATCRSRQKRLFKPQHCVFDRYSAECHFLLNNPRMLHINSLMFRLRSFLSYLTCFSRLRFLSLYFQNFPVLVCRH